MKREEVIDAFEDAKKLVEDMGELLKKYPQLGLAMHVEYEDLKRDLDLATKKIAEIRSQ